MKAPELKSVEAFGDFLLADDRTEFTFDEACTLAETLGQSVPVYVIRGLKALGFTMKPREVYKHIRGFTTNSHDRWSAYPNHGGSGWQQIAGFAGDEG